MKLLMKLGRMRRLGGLGRLREVRQVGVRAARAEMWDRWECEPKPANAWSWVCGGNYGTGGILWKKTLLKSYSGYSIVFSKVFPKLFIKIYFYISLSL